jgi:hypothetical protein
MNNIISYDQFIQEKCGTCEADKKVKNTEKEEVKDECKCDKDGKCECKDGKSEDGKSEDEKSEK